MFLGREPVLAKLGGWLEGSRLVTLAGPPGIGKSRLGVELAHRVAGDYPGGAWLVELAPVSDGELVPAALAAAMSISEEPGRDLTETVVGRLGSGRALVVLDNCEHLVDACAELSDGLLRGCPELRIIATSRETLAVAGEQVCPVPPLEVPPPRDANSDGDSGLAVRLLGFESVKLFVERAQAAKPGFALDRDSAGAVGEICRRLDGIPLAIELAAARVAMLTAREVAGRLDDRFGLLIGGSRSDLPRHQTLQAAVDWSYDLLDRDEQALLARLSVFAGGFTLEGAEAICAGEGETRGEVLETLGWLVSKSLIGADTANSRGRYRMLETIRAYATDRLVERPDASGCAEAHARYYVDLAERAEPEFVGPKQEAWFERIEGEHENVREAIRWCVGHDRAEWALRIAGALVLFWRVRCRFKEGRGLAHAAVEAGKGGGTPSEAKAQWGAGFLAHMAGDEHDAVRWLQESLATFRDLDDLKGSARALLVLANCRQFQADPTAQSLLDESAALAREADDSWCLAHALALTGFEYASCNQLPAARARFEECLTVARRAQDAQGLRFGLLGLGRVALLQGDYDSAEALLDEAIIVARGLRENYVRATALTFLGELALARGDYHRAADLHDEATSLMQGMGLPGATVDSALLRAKVAQATGDRLAARRGFEQALLLAGDDRTLVGGLQGIGEMAVEDGDSGKGQALLEQARAVALSIDDKHGVAQANHGLGRLARAGGDIEEAGSLHVAALDLQRQIGDAPGIASSLEAVAGLTAAAGRHAAAARLFGAATAMRDSGGYARAPSECLGYRADVVRAREGLSPSEVEAAFAQGAGLSTDAVIGEATKRRGRRRSAGHGWASLTPSERQVAALAAEGLTNAQIAERLFIAPTTAKNHLAHIFAKLGIARRSELVGEVLRREQTERDRASRSARPGSSDLP